LVAYGSDGCRIECGKSRGGGFSSALIRPIPGPLAKDKDKEAAFRQGIPRWGPRGWTADGEGMGR
jgi:hypothetical protein